MLVYALSPPPPYTHTHTHTHTHTRMQQINSLMHAYRDYLYLTIERKNRLPSDDRKRKPNMAHDSNPPQQNGSVPHQGAPEKEKHQLRVPRVPRTKPKPLPIRRDPALPSRPASFTRC